MLPEDLTPGPASAPPDNGQVARVFERIADSLEIQGENQFKIRAYRNAVETLRSLDVPVARLAGEGRLKSLPGFGDAIQAKIEDILETGTTALHDRVKESVPDGVVELLRLPGIGAKTVKQLWQGLDIKTLAMLEAALDDGRVATLHGMGEKTVEKIRQAIEKMGRYAGVVRIDEGFAIARSLADDLRARPEVARVEIAGALRRGVETVREIELVAVSTDPPATIAAFRGHPRVASTLLDGPDRVRVTLHAGIEAELRLAAPGEFAAVLRERTGSSAHTARLAAIRAGGGDAAADVDSEESLYARLGLPWITPELREDTGEIEAAVAGTLPRLITAADIRGDLHAHTTASDGRASLAEMAAAALALGYEYMAVTDHSYSLAVAGGLTPERLRAQIAEIRVLEDRLGIRVFAGSEVDVKADGTLDFDDDLLSSLDFVIASLHLFNQQDAAHQTARMLRVIANPHVDLIAHPTGRLVNRRDPYALDLEAVFDAAARTGTALEINAAPERLDLRDEYAREAARRGVRILINTDAHRPEDYNLMSYGILTARRAWLTPADVLNTRALADFEAWLGR